MITGAAQMDGRFCCLCYGRPHASDQRAHPARQVGVPAIVVFLNKCDLVDDEELLELVEMEVREELNSREFGYRRLLPRSIIGSALKALEGDADERSHPSWS